MVVGSIEAAPSIGAASIAALALAMGSFAATPPIRHARPDIMAAASIAVGSPTAVGFTAEAVSTGVVSTGAAE